MIYNICKNVDVHMPKSKKNDKRKTEQIISKSHSRILKPSTLLNIVPVIKQCVMGIERTIS